MLLTLKKRKQKSTKSTESRYIDPMSNKRSEKTLIIGSLGQVGQALFKGLMGKYNVLRHDIIPRYDRNDHKIDTNVDPEIAQDLIMHICVPYEEGFDQMVKEYTKVYNPKLVIIHSSVKVGTTVALHRANIPVVHSPVIIDNEYFQSIVNFRKMIGYDDSEQALVAEKHLRPCFNTALVANSFNTELSDICLGLYHLTCRAMTFEMYRMFRNVGMDYNVMMELITTNNIGFASLNKGSMLLQNMFPNLNKQDYRVGLMDLIPEEITSAFFKLAKRSYAIEENRNEEQHAKAAI